MTSEQELFLDLAVIQQMSYAQIVEQTGIERKELSKWWADLKEQRESLSKIRQTWKRKCDEINFWAFHKWYISTEKKCYYCGLTEEKVAVLIDSQKVFTKRLPTRGRNLEIERLEANLPYDEVDNLVFCCYWCNNAKTDEFAVEEFMEIGKCLSEIWSKRLTQA